VRALTVFFVNRRTTVHRFYSDISYAFQARLELVSESGFRPRRDLSGYRAQDWDLRIADLHYRDLNEWAVGRNAAAGWDAPEGNVHGVTRVWTDPLPSAEVERVAPNEDADLKARVSFGMETLAQLAEGDGVGLRSALADLPGLYGTWINAERGKLGGLPARRKETAERLIADMEKAKARIATGIDLLATDSKARDAFRFMNLAVAMAARRRVAGTTGDHATLAEPQWRPFQLAFVLLNLAGLVDRRHVDRETADLLFFPTGGGKTEAYLGLAAIVIAHRRLGGSGVLGAGVAVIMRYTLRLLTLDQLTRAAGVVCALELMRTDAKNVDDKGRRMLGDWPIEIADSPFADRRIKEPMELTSRVSTDEVAKAKQRLEAVFGRDAETVDIALATNMISVGLDITRLGVMVVQGQPKTAAEYIQATSRVGRDHNRPGIVLAVLNLHKPRDRMHFEQFGQFHRTFYRAVEATSVTPWAARALDRALAAVVVAAARHVDGALTPDVAVNELKNNVWIRNLVRDSIVNRAPERMIADGRAALAALIDDIFDAWIETSNEQAAGGNAFAYAKKKSPHRLLHMPLEPEIANLAEPHRRFVAGRSMRDVEPNVTLKVRDPHGNTIANADDLA